MTSINSLGIRCVCADFVNAIGPFLSLLPDNLPPELTTVYLATVGKSLWGLLFGATSLKWTFNEPYSTFASHTNRAIFRFCALFIRFF